MKAQRPSWQDLNAYVDGELSPRESSRVARAVAADAHLADQVATLSRLKAALHESQEAAPEIAMPGNSAGGPAWRLGRSGWRAAAAGLAAVAVTGAIAVFALWPRGPEIDYARVIGQAAAAHHAWLAEESDGGAAPITAGRVLVGLHRFGGQAHMPDLSAARLTITRLKVFEPGPGGGPVLHIGYAGTRGCRVSLWAGAAGAGFPAAFNALGDGADTAYSWRVGSVAYVMLAKGMDPARLALIAGAAYRATLEHAPPNVDTRTALAKSRAESRPCRG